MSDGAQQFGLIGGVEKRKIEIVAYDPQWPHVFQTHAINMALAMGSAALRIEHIGSTAVPGLGAKPIVDILLVVEDAAVEDAYLDQLQQAGYQLRVREPEFHQHRMFRTPKRDVHIHVFSRRCPEIERYLTFRNRLRSNAAERQLYEETKRRLAP